MMLKLQKQMFFSSFPDAILLLDEQKQQVIEVNEMAEHMFENANIQNLLSSVVLKKLKSTFTRLTPGSVTERNSILAYNF